MGSSILFSQIGNAADRNPEFVTEIQAILRQHGQPVGTLDAVPGLAACLKQPGPLRDDLVSMVNALCYQEPGTTTLDLVGLLLVAAAGKRSTDELAADPALEEPVRRVFNALVEARRARQQEDEARLASDEDLTEHAHSGFQPSSQDLEAQTPPDAVPRPTEPASHAVSRGSVLARALAISADGHDGHAASQPSLQQAPLEPRATVQPSEAELPVQRAERVTPARALFASEPEVIHASRRVPGWVMGLCGIALGLLLGFLLQKKASAPAPVQVPATADVVNGTSRETVGGPVSSARGGSGVRNRSGDLTRGSRRGANNESSKAASGEPATRRPAAPAASEAGAPDTTADSSLVTGSNPSAPAKAPSLRAPQPPPVRPIDLNGSGSGVALPTRVGVRLPSVVTGASGIMAANLVAAPAPAYPAAASAAKVQGEVIIQAVVDREGNVSEARVVSGPPLLRDAALDAVQRWRFRPYEVDGSAAEIGTTARIEFRLNH